MTDTLLPIAELRFETAGEHHTQNIPTAVPDDLAGAVWDRIRGRRFDSAREIVVCDAAGRLAGLVSIENLLAADEMTRVGDLMDPAPPAVSPGTDQEIAVWRAIRHGETSLAVVDDEHRFQGLITSRRILEVLLWEHDEDTARLSGVLIQTAAARAAVGESVRRSLRHRLPWLLLGLVGAALSAELVGLFEAKLHAQVIVAFFVPGIVYLADAVGTQTETLAIRGLSVGMQIERAFRQEIVAGLAIGFVLAALLFPFVAWRWGRVEVAFAVSVSLFAACSVASTVAMALPLGLKRLGYDPAFAAGPLATVIQDLLSVLIYFLVCLAVI